MTPILAEFLDEIWKDVSFLALVISQVVTAAVVTVMWWKGRHVMEQAGEILAARVIEFMQELRMPNGLAAVGYSESDIPALVEGTLPQHRVTKLSPRPAGPDELAELFRASMTIW